MLIAHVNFTYPQGKLLSIHSQFPCRAWGWVVGVLLTGALPLVSFDLHYYDTELIWSVAGLFTIIKFNSCCNILHNYYIMHDHAVHG